MTGIIVQRWWMELLFFVYHHEKMKYGREDKVTADW